MGGLHARLNPSSAPGWTGCSDYPNAQVGKPDPPKEPAQKGTCSHWVLEQTLRFGAPPGEFVGKTLFLTSDGETLVLADDQHEGRKYVFEPCTIAALHELPGHLWTITEEMANYAQVAASYAYRVAERLDAEVQAEQRVNPGVLLDRDDCSGTADITIYGNDELHNYDLKTGGYRVMIDGNQQLILYAIGAFANLSVEQRVRLKKIVIGIIQPTMSEKYQITTAELSVQDLWKWVFWFKARAILTDAENPPRTPGDKQCKWCLDKPNCSALQSKIFEGVFELNDEHTTRTEIVCHGEAVTTQEPEDIELEKLSAILELIPLARDYFSALESHATDLLKSGVDIPEQKLVRKDTHKAWVDDKLTVIRKLTTNLKLPKKDILKDEVPISPTAVERLVKAYSKNYPDKDPLSDRKLRGLQAMIIKPQGGLVIAPTSDPRPAVAFSEKQIFAHANEPWFTGEGVDKTG